MIRANPWLNSSLFLLFVLYIHVLRINDAFVFLGVAVRRSSRPFARPCARRCALRRLGCFVHLLGKFVRSLSQLLAGLVHGRLVAAFQRFLGVGNRVLDIAAFRAGDFIALLAQHLLDSVDHGIELVLGVDRFTLSLVLG